MMQAGFGAKAGPAGPTLGPGLMNDPEHLIHHGRDTVSRTPPLEPAHGFQVGALFLQHISLLFPTALLPMCVKRGTRCPQEDVVPGFSEHIKTLYLLC